MERTDRQHEYHSKRELLAVSLIRGVAGPGLNSSLGLFFPAVSVAFGVGIGPLAWSVSIGALAGMICLPAAGWLFEHLGVRSMAVAGVLLVALSFLGNGFTEHLAWWYVLAVPFGVGTVLIVNMLGPLVLDGEGGIGSSLGWMMTLAGVIAIPIQPLLTSWVARGGERAGYFAGGILALVVMLPCAMTLPRALPHCSRSRHETVGAEPGKPAFALLYLLLFIIVSYNAFHQHLAPLATAYDFSASAVGVALSFAMCGVAVGGLVIGYVTHRAGGGAGGYLTLGVAAVSVLLFLFAGRVTAWFTVACFLHGVASAAIGITAQTIAREICQGDYTRFLSRLLTAIPLATVIATPLWGMCYDRTGSYMLSLWGILALIGVGVGCLLALSLLKRKDPSDA